MKSTAIFIFLAVLIGAIIAVRIFELKFAKTVPSEEPPFAVQEERRPAPLPPTSSTPAATFRGPDSAPHINGPTANPPGY